MRPTIWLILFLASLAATAAGQDSPPDSASVQIRLPRIVLDGVPFNGWLVPIGVPAGDSIDYRIALPGRPAAAAGTEMSGRLRVGRSSRRPRRRPVHPAARSDSRSTRRRARRAAPASR